MYISLSTLWLIFFVAWFIMAWEETRESVAASRLRNLPPPDPARIARMVQNTMDAKYSPTTQRRMARELARQCAEGFIPYQPRWKTDETQYVRYIREELQRLNFPMS